MTTKHIDVPILARVEGEGALSIDIKDDVIERCQLKIYEPPRLFEKFLENRHYNEVLDFVARICGICPVAYQMSATQAIESVFDVQVNDWISAMRRVFYCGEWIESHSLHIHLLAAPDFLGFHSVQEMAVDYPEEVKRGLRIQKVGNDLIKLFGKRSVHPIGACVGGFYAGPKAESIQKTCQALQSALADAEALIDWSAKLVESYDNSHAFISVALHHPDRYAMSEGEITTSAGQTITRADFENHFNEAQVPHSNALHCHLNGDNYLVGPLARVNLNYAQLPSALQTLLKNINIAWPSQNMFHSIVARAIEIYFCLYESLNILSSYQSPSSAKKAVHPKAGIGYGATEAPRGLLWHRYEFDSEGIVQTAKIVPPTSQNQARIEDDLTISLKQFGLDKDTEDLRAYSEMLIRNYDPCISCATHFLNLTVHRH